MSATGVPRLNWQLARDLRHRQECWITGEFCLVVEPTDKTLSMYRVAEIRHGAGSALYRSARSWPEAEAKRQAVMSGVTIARREAKKHTEIADLLSRYQQSPAPAASEGAPQRAHGERARDPERDGAEKLHAEEIGGSGRKD